MIVRSTFLWFSGLALLASAVSLGGRAAATPSERSVVAVKAGTLHVVAEGRVVENGTILIRGNVIEAVGDDITIPPDAQVIDYGPDAHVVLGLVAAYSRYASGAASRRTAEPGLSVLEAFDFERTYASALANGVTSVYVMPAEGRLIAGTSAIVKLAGNDPERRTVLTTAAIHGAVDKSASAVKQPTR